MKSKSLTKEPPSGTTIELASGAHIFVRQSGDGEELVLFLHAVGGDHESFGSQMEAFSKERTCATFDFRGHGLSQFPDLTEGVKESISIKSFAEDTIELIGKLGFLKAHLVGVSMGGVVALEVFKQNKQVVQSLTLANTWCYQPEGDMKITFMTDRLSRMSLMDSAKELMPSLFAPGCEKAIVDKAIQTEGSKNKAVFLASWLSMFRQDYRPLLAQVDVPTLLIGGTEDKITPTEPLLTTIYSYIPTAQLVNIEGAGHFSNQDHPNEFNQALSVHLNRASSGQSEKIASGRNEKQTLDADTTAHALIGLLNKRGIKYLFSNSGTDFTPIIDALAKHKDDPDFRLKEILLPHENTAIAAAHGYYLVAKKPAAIMAHVNVGTANSGLGIINASRSRIPMLMMAGKTPWYESEVDGCRTNFVQWGQDTFDQAAYFREFTKWDYELKGARNLETTIDRALAIAQSDPQGPVYLMLPKEPLCEKIAGFNFYKKARQQAQCPSEPDTNAAFRAAQMIASSKRPLVITAELGRYTLGPEALVQLARENGIGVIEHGKHNFFNFPSDHPMHLGFSPSPYVEEADLVIAIETHVPWVPALAKVQEAPPTIQIGVDPLCQKLPMRGFPADLTISGNPALALKKITEHLRALVANEAESSRTIRERTERTAAEHKRLIETAYMKAKQEGAKKEISKSYLSYCIGQMVDDNCLIFNEYNLDPALVPRHLPGSWFENSIASGLGWALGAAVGAQLASPTQTMVATVGDGAYLFNTPLSAHYAASAYKLPILVIIFNDGGWNTIKHSYLGTTPGGHAEKKNHFPLTAFDIDMHYEKIAEAAGGIGMRCESPESLPLVLKQALRTVRQDRKQVLVNVICKPNL